MKQLKSIADLKYGNINKEDLANLMNQDEMLVKFVEQFKNYPYPNKEKTIEEIESIIKFQSSVMSNEKWVKFLEFSKHADEDLYDFLSSQFNTIGILVEPELLEDLNDEIAFIITSLKVHYNRPRPYQVAYYTEQNLNPFHSVTANSPSYPSGHSCQSWFTCLYLAKKYPEKREQLLKIATMIENSRIVLGVHFRSDNDFGKKIAEAIIEMPEFEHIYF